MNIFSTKNIAIAKPKTQSGFTLLEIMVALALGVAILAATINMQIQHQKGFKLSSNKLEMQTNAKFAFEFISRSLRSAGSMGCRNAISLRNDDTDFTDGCLGNACISFNTPSIAYADFRPGFEVIGYEYTGTGFTPSPPVAFEFVSNSYFNADSDALTVAGGYGEVYDVAADITAVDLGLQLDMTNISQIGIKQSQYGMLTSCKGAKIFKITSTNASIGSGNIQWGGGGAADDNSAGQPTIEEASVITGSEEKEFRRAAVTTYFVGMHPFNDVKGVPTLYQDVDGEPKRLIEGVEEMHVLYGLSEGATNRNVADRYVTADVISAESTATNNKWESVVSVRIGLIMRSSEPVFSSDRVQNISLACVGYNQSTKTDQFSRSTYCAESSLRNRLVGSRVGTKT